jgi:hypothetical protein
MAARAAMIMASTKVTRNAVRWLADLNANMDVLQILLLIIF